jgi:hypothetical protein
MCFLLCFCPFTACLKTPMQMRMMIFWTTPPSKSAVGLHPQNQRQWCRSSVAVPASTFVASVCIDLTCIGSVLFGKTTPRASALYLKCTLSSSIFADITNSWLLAMSAFLIVNKVSMCHIPPCYVNLVHNTYSQNALSTAWRISRNFLLLAVSCVPLCIQHMLRAYHNNYSIYPCVSLLFVLTALLSSSQPHLYLSTLTLKLEFSLIGDLEQQLHRFYLYYKEYG